MKIFRIKVTRARVRQATPVTTVKVVSSRVTFLFADGFLPFSPNLLTP